MDLLVGLLSEQAIASILTALLAMIISYPLIKVVERAFAGSPDADPETDSDAAPTDASKSPSADDATAVKVMVLGLEGSGKTMMLVGMYHRWAFGSRHGVTLRADETTSRFLSMLARKINNPDCELPAGTRAGDITKAIFTFMVDVVGDSARSSFSLHYADYAGERIRGVLFPSESQSSPDPEVMASLAEAHVLVGVLDGGEIASAMREKLFPPEFANTLMGLMLYLATAKQKTIHLVISKWDLVVDENGQAYPLSKVIEFLDQYPPFYQFHQRPPLIGVRRIIPISTFGLNGFIRVDANGTTHKDHTLQWQPFMAENAVACSVPDVIDTELGHAIETAERVKGRLPRRSLAPLLKVVLTVLNTVTAQWGLRLFDTKGITSEELVRTWWTLKGDLRTDKLEHHSSKPEVILRVLRLFAESVRELEKKFPESKIGHYRPRRTRSRGTDTNDTDGRPR